VWLKRLKILDRDVMHWACSGIRSWAGNTILYRKLSFRVSLQPPKSMPPFLTGRGKAQTQSGRKRRLRVQLSDLQLRGRVALVTGGSRGIGKAIVELLSELGAHVVVNYVKGQE